jgi:predicted DNA-binding protein with PD1-like motif
MRSSEGRVGRVFVIRLDDGDVVPDCIERFAAARAVSTGYALLVGGAGRGEVVVGPRDSAAMPPDPMALPLDGAHEVSGVGVLAPGADGKPVLHMHAALGRAGRTMTGCLRKGVKTWLVGEAVLVEITGAAVRRVKDEKSGFALLVPAGEPGKRGKPAGK